MEKIYGFVSIDIHEGQTEAFIERARACHDAAIPDLTGTQVYDWFLSADGRKAFVLEVYDDADAVAHHSKMAGGKVGNLLDISDFRIMFAGDVPGALVERMRAKLGEASCYARLAMGRLSDPSPHRDIAGNGPCERVFATAFFRPHKGKAAEFRAVADELFAHACASDPGTWGYEWFFNNDGDCFAFDIYENAPAMAAHMANCGPYMAQILKIADSETTVFGVLPLELEARMRPELNIARYPRQLQGVI